MCVCICAHSHIHIYIYMYVYTLKRAPPEIQIIRGSMETNTGKH